MHILTHFSNILKYANILDLNALKFYYKYLYGKLPSYFYGFNIVTQGSQHSYNTRQSDQIRIDRTRAEILTIDYESIHRV